MKTSITRIIPGTLLAGVLLFSVSAWSMGPRGGQDPERMLNHLSDKLELTEAQQDELQSVLGQSHLTLQADRERMEALRESLKAMRDDFDAGEATRLATELGEITGRVAFEMASTRATLYQLLTPEQREEMDEMEAQREKRMQKFRPGR